MLSRQLVLQTTAAVFSAAAIAVAFNNCSPSFSIDTPQRRSLSSNCKPSLKAAVSELSSEHRARICGEITSYQCDVREFRPGIGNSSASEPACLVTSLGEKCLAVTITRFDTSDQRGLPDLPADAFNEGGAFNYSEATCFNKEILVDGLAVFRAEGSTVDAALSEVMQKCQNGSP